MRTINLNTGVVVTFDDKDNMIALTTPYWATEPLKMTKLRWYVQQIKAMI